MVLLNKAKCMARMNVAPSILRYVHPAFRRFLSRRKIRRCLRKQNSSLAKKIRNRSLRYSVLPRAAPFLCSKCGFATIALKKIEEHVCIKKNSLVIDLERDMKVARMGMRSKCKDAMAVLERVPNPQSIRLPKFHILESEPAVEMCGMIFSSLPNTLQIGVNSSISPPDPLPKVVSPIASCSNDEEMQKCPEDNSFDKQTLKADVQCAKSEMALHGNCIYNAYLKPDSSPTHSFKPVSAEASVDYTILKEHKMGHRISKCNAKEKFNLRCTACGIESDKLRMMEDFHEHIMNCGKYRR